MRTTVLWWWIQGGCHGLGEGKRKREDGQEDARVLYVGLTRAASRCYLYQAPVLVRGRKTTCPNPHHEIVGRVFGKGRRG